VETAPAREPMAAGFTGRVLLMDDEPGILRMAAMVLRRLGFTVVETADGTEALAAFTAARERKEPFDLVITDLTVPGAMGGEETVRAMRALDPHLRAIVSSGYSSDPVLANFRDYGFSGRIAKPYQLSDFIRVIRQVMDGS
jgi:CheY-like chemotaxis protein